MKLTRRDLVRFFAAMGGCAVIEAGSMSAAFASAPAKPAGASTFSFPLGVASADPQPDAIVLWTKVAGGPGDTSLVVEVANSPDFEVIEASSTVIAEAAYASTVRVLVTGLKPDHVYHYRFRTPDGSCSRSGRTRTAPLAHAERELRVAVFSCQDYEQGFFSAYRSLIERDRAAPAGEQIDFVLHVGDFIYETVRGPRTRGWPNLNGEPVSLLNPDGTPRRLGPKLPSGGRPGAFGYLAPASLPDYRTIYEAYLLDPDLQDARALYPFVQVWDDHETFNDVWQSYEDDNSAAELRMAGNQAWFEYIPAALAARDGAKSARHRAHPFRRAPVRNAPIEVFDDDYFSTEQNNMAAVGSLTIYRQLSWGRMADLFLIDGRSYRSPKLEFPGLQETRQRLGAPVTMPPGLLAQADLGRTAPSPSETLPFAGGTVKNARHDRPRGTMLGRAQREWLLDGLRQSPARWKILGFNVGLLRFGFDDSFQAHGNKNGIFWLDGWDGFPAERRQITRFIRNERISNVVSLTGDRHMHVAGLVEDDFDGRNPVPIATEFAGASVSAPCRLAIMAAVLGATNRDYAARIVSDGTALPGGKKFGPAMDAWLVHGQAAAKALHDGDDIEAVRAKADPEVNPHLAYSDAGAFGYVTAVFRRTGASVSMHTIAEPDRFATSVPTVRTITFDVPAQRGARQPELRIGKIAGDWPVWAVKQPRTRR